MDRKGRHMEAVKKNPLSMQIDPALFEPATDEEKQQQEVMSESVTFFRDGMRKLMKNPLAVGSIIVLALIIITIIFAPLVVPYSYSGIAKVNGRRDRTNKNLSAFQYSQVEQEYIDQADDVLTILQFENIAAYPDLDRILSIDDLDVILLGPCDLAASMGHIGDWYHPEVDTVVKELFEKTHRAGKKIGVSYGLCTAEEMERYEKLGVDMISIAADTDFIVRGCRDLRKKMGEIFLHS